MLAPDGYLFLAILAFIGILAIADSIIGFFLKRRKTAHGSQNRNSRKTNNAG